ncbi:TPA: helix-turn-helix domain-containing protein [Klebsiella michiganensis]|nr:helix-turn-helix domain-containing protein [Klebsiella michiganensis]
MKKDTATQVFESLASGIRLDVYRLLVKAGPQGMVAGQIASSLAIVPNKLSFHLKAMTHAELLSVEQEGRFQRYRANIPLMLELITFLTEECCSGHPEKCISLYSNPSCSSTEPFRDAILAVVDAYQNGHKVAFHCGAGRGRTGTVAAGVLLELKISKTVPEAVERAKSIRPVFNIKPIQYQALGLLYPEPD